MNNSNNYNSNKTLLNMKKEKNSKPSHKYSKSVSGSNKLNIMLNLNFCNNNKYNNYDLISNDENN